MWHLFTVLLCKTQGVDGFRCAFTSIEVTSFSRIVRNLKLLCWTAFGGLYHRLWEKKTTKNLRGARELSNIPSIARWYLTLILLVTYIPCLRIPQSNLPREVCLRLGTQAKKLYRLSASQSWNGLSYNRRLSNYISIQYFVIFVAFPDFCKKRHGKKSVTHRLLNGCNFPCCTILSVFLRVFLVFLDSCCSEKSQLTVWRSLAVCVILLSPYDSAMGPRTPRMHVSFLAVSVSVHILNVFISADTSNRRSSCDSELCAAWDTLNKNAIAMPSLYLAETKYMMLFRYTGAAGNGFQWGC